MNISVTNRLKYGSGVSFVVLFTSVVKLKKIAPISN